MKTSCSRSADAAPTHNGSGDTLHEACTAAAAELAAEAHRTSRHRYGHCLSDEMALYYIVIIILLLLLLLLLLLFLFLFLLLLLIFLLLLLLLLSSVFVIFTHMRSPRPFSAKQDAATATRALLQGPWQFNYL